MYGVTRDSGSVQYRCVTNGQEGSHACKGYTIPESKILPAVLDLLVEEVDKVLAMPEPEVPNHLRSPAGAKDEQQRAAFEKQVKALNDRIERAAENLMEADDRTRPIMQKKIDELWAEHDRLQAELESAAETTWEQWDRIKEFYQWWSDTKARLIPVPCDDAARYVEPAVLRETLVALGCEVRLRWKTKTVTLSNGKKQMRHELTHGRFRMGQKSGLLRRNNLEASARRSFCFGAEYPACRVCPCQRFTRRVATTGA